MVFRDSSRIISECDGWVIISHTSGYMEQRRLTKLDRAQAYAAAVRQRNPGMQVRRLTERSAG